MHNLLTLGVTYMYAYVYQGQTTVRQVIEITDTAKT